MEDDNDVHEWEFLPDEGFLQIHDDHHTRYSPYHNHLFVTNYFVFPSVRSSLNLPDPKQIHLQSPSDQISLLKLELEQPDDDDEDEEIVSHVSFKKLIARENEFADMKLDSPKMMNSNSMAVLPQIDLGALIQYELEDDASETESDHPKNSCLTSWKRNLTGIGAICSFGVVAAATFCFIILGIQRKNNRGGDSKLQFQIFSDDNKIHHKNSISMPVSFTRAHVSFNLEC